MAQKDLKIVVTLYHKGENLGTSEVEINDDIFGLIKEREYWLNDKVAKVGSKAVKDALANYDKKQWEK